MRGWTKIFGVCVFSISLFAAACGESPVNQQEENRASGKSEQSVTKDSAVLKIATFNTHLFWDQVCDSGSCDGSFEEVPSAATYNAKLDKITNGIRQLNADIVILQEIENQSVLDDIMTKVSDLYSGGVIGEQGYAASIDTAILYNGQLLATLFHTDLTEGNSDKKKFARVFLELQLAYSAEAQEKEEADLIIFGAHFVSKATADSDDRRLAEALTARKYLEERAEAYPGALIVMGGDLNDGVDSDPLNALEESPVLLRVASDLPEGSQATYIYRGQKYALDHLFMVKNEGGSYNAGSARVYKDGTGWAGSDHGALRAEFSLNQ